MKKNLRSYIILVTLILVIVFIKINQLNTANTEKLNHEHCYIPYGCVTNDNKIVKDNFIIKDNKIILKGYYKKKLFKSGVANNYYDLLQINAAHFSIPYETSRVGNNLELVFEIKNINRDMYIKINEYNIKYDCFKSENITSEDEVFNITYEQNFYLYYVYNNSLKHFCDNLENQSNCRFDFAVYLRQ